MNKDIVTGEGHFVREFMIGNTHVRIADDYCRDKTPEEVETILRRIARTAQEHITAAAYRCEACEQEQLGSGTG